jgi:hypothetical protein
MNISPDVTEKTKELYNKLVQLHHEMLDYWTDEVTFGFHWLIGVSFTVFPWILWIIFRNKESTYRLLLAGLFVMVASMLLDTIGVVNGLWYYHLEVIPLMPAHFPFNFSLMPVTIMLFLQIRPNGNVYFKALLFSSSNSFLAEPLFIWLKLYHPLKWEHIYSFPIYFLIYLVSHFLVTRKQFSMV